MVTDTTERRNFPAYALVRVHELAAAGKVIFSSRSVLRDTEDYGYPPEDVYRCLTELTERHFHHSERYIATPGWYDVYIIVCMNSQGTRDSLYVKFKLSGSMLSIELFSFHPERWK